MTAKVAVAIAAVDVVAAVVEEEAVAEEAAVVDVAGVAATNAPWGSQLPRRLEQ